MFYTCSKAIFVFFYLSCLNELYLAFLKLITIDFGVKLELCSMGCSLEFLFVRSNRISVCRITVLSLESRVSQRRISVCHITMLSLESLFVRSNRITVCRC